MLKDFIAIDIQSTLGLRAYINPKLLAQLTVWEFIGYYVERFAAGAESLITAERQGKVLGYNE